MSENQYFIDKQYTMWVRTIFNVKASNDREANEIAKQVLQDLVDPYDIPEVDILSTEPLEADEPTGKAELFKVNRENDELIMEVNK